MTVSARMASEEDHLENLMSHLGEFGRYQLIQSGLLLLAALTAGVHMLSLVTILAVPEHRCAVGWLPENGTWDSAEVRAAIPLDPDGGLSSCLVRSPDTNLSQPCDSWLYDTTTFASSRVTQWDLVCDRRWMGALAQSLYMAGVFVGAITAGTLADKYGRKLILCWSATLQLIVGMGIAFISNYYLFLFIIFFYGSFGSAGAFVTSFVLMMELVGGDKRTVCGAVFQGMFAIGVMLVPFWAAVVQGHTYLQLIYGAHSILLIGHWWLIDESPRWLWSQGRITESVNIVAKGVLLNRAPGLDRAHYISKGKVRTEEAAREEAPGLADLFRTPRLRAKTLNIALNCSNLNYQPMAWLVDFTFVLTWRVRRVGDWVAQRFANSMAYYGLSLNSNKMEGDPLVNMMLLGLVELPCYVVVAVLVDRTGRRSLTSAFMLLAGIACIFTAYLPQEEGRIVAYLGKFCISGSFAIIYNYSAELFPTVLRNTGIGFGSMAARIAAFFTPAISLLDVIDEKIPILVFAGMTLLSGFLTLFLPETLNKPMPQTLEDGETFGAGDTAFSRSKYQKPSSNPQTNQL